MLGDGTYDFSFSGLKTAVVNHVRKHPEVATADVAASFQEAVVDVLVTKTDRGRPRGRRQGPLPRAAGWPPTRGCGSGSSTPASTDGLRGFLPSRAMCTDNAAMVASAAWYRWQSDGPSPLDTGALRCPNLGRSLGRADAAERPAERHSEGARSGTRRLRVLIRRA